ncbi:MAG: PIG-L family deacetylase [Pseudomonadota bacterium]|nr:PIG-L family deacetylase [Pseudomonadota bacterium]
MNTTLLPDEPSIYPYHAERVLPARSVLVFAPHPDDEVLGCGGLIAAWLDAGVPVQVVIVSDGAQGGDAPERERESQAAAQALAAGSAPASLHFWQLPDRGLRADATLVERMRECIVGIHADCVLAPSLYEVHPDHRSVALAAAQAFAAVFDDESTAQLAFYEVGQPLPANTLVDITAVLARKQAAIGCFGSQLLQQPYGEQLLALNRYRSYTLGSAVTHAEAYQVVRAAALRAGPGAAVRAQAAAVMSRLGLRS